jgi:hypothetical protein
MPATDAPYLTPTSVAPLIPGGLSATSNPNLTSVGSIIWAISAEVESAAAHAGYSVPIGTSAEAFAQLGEVVKRGVLYQAGLIRFPGNGPGTRTGFVDDFRRDYYRALEQIRDGDAPLIGATLDTSETVQITGRSFSTSNAGEPERSEARITWNQEF